ncbi:ankyrin repeat domain-containing protein 45 isoform 3-T3 [Liasis olivaceus]
MRGFQGLMLVQTNLEDMESLEETVASAKRNEHEDLGPQEESAYFNPLLRAALRGYTLLHCAAAWGQLDTLKTLVELEADIYATTFRGEKAREIANRYKQTECVEFLDWAEAKQNLRNFISQVQATVTDPEKVQGRLNKEDKTTSIKACQAKLDWLENTKDPTAQDFIDQKQQLEDIMLPIFTKLATPRVQDSTVKKT